MFHRCVRIIILYVRARARDTLYVEEGGNEK